MKISSQFINTPLKEYKVQVDWRSIMNYAAAINDDNPKYFNDESEDGIVAHPMFPVAVTWPIMENLSEYINSENFPLRVFATIVHYYEHLKIYRLIRPNDELKIHGTIIAILPHRAGTHVTLRLDALDKNNDLVFTEYIGGMLRGVKCVGDSKGEESLPIRPILKNDDEPVWKKNVYIDRLRSFVYDGCTDIIFPIHTSKKFAHFVGLPDIILQGTATLAFAVKEIINIESERDPNKVQEIACNFSGMVYPDSNISIQMKKKKETGNSKEIFFEVFNQENRKAIRNGYILLKK
ncbi:MAG TPA: MaoC/PaaZ C-terminal domain-containing protein [Candidatus Nanopelagicaceae bacterium]|jgi:acyl dehydratase|nr:MaoC/PaaZ C-terminal domain-containing protein [Candidatus Nanopelagicaceae bacterium]